jgi:hypothetical protein
MKLLLTSITGALFCLFMHFEANGQLNAHFQNQFYTICLGESMNIEFQGSGGTPPYVFYYSFNGGPVETISSGASSSATVVFTGNQVGNVTCTLHQVDDSFTSTQLNSTGQFYVAALPNVSAGPDVTICQGQSYTPMPSGAVVYSWNNSLINDLPFQPTQTAIYTVVGIDINGCFKLGTSVSNCFTLPTSHSECNN